MATLLSLESKGELFKIDAALGPRQQEFRRIFVLPRVMDWLVKTLPGLGSEWQIELSPNEQMDAFLEVYCSGQPLTFDRQIKPLCHIRDGIWELKTSDLRLFGWFAQMDDFICTDADMAGRVKTLHLYRPYCDQACRFRDALDLDDPKFIDSEDPNVVVSNFNFPK